MRLLSEVCLDAVASGATTLEEPELERLLQLAYEPAHGGLRDVHHLRGTPGTGRQHQGSKGLDLARLQVAPGVRLL